MMPSQTPFGSWPGRPRQVRGVWSIRAPSLGILLALEAFTYPTPLSAGTVEVTSAAAHAGAYGLEIALGACIPATLNLAPPPSTISGVFTGCTTLAAQGVQIVAPGAELRAGSSVVLGNGFAVAQGAPLTVRLIDALGGPWAFVQDGSPEALTAYRARFRIDADNLTLQPGDRLDHLTGHASDGTLLFRVSLEPDAASGQHQVVLAARNDNGGFAETPLGEHQLLPPGRSEVEVEWKAHAGDGYLLIGIGHPAVFGLRELTNGAARLNSIRWGAVSGTVTTSTGSLLLDDFRSFR